MDRTQKNKSDVSLDELFQATRNMEPAPSKALMARVLADAIAVQAEQSTQAEETGRAAPIARAKPGWSLGPGFRQVASGWASTSVLAAVACFGLVIGLVMPETILAYLQVVEMDTVDAGLGYLDVYGVEIEILEG